MQGSDGSASRNVPSARFDALEALWHAKHVNNRIPARGDFSLEELAPFMGRLALLDVVDGGRDFRFRLFGTGIADDYRAEMTGKLVSEYRDGYREPILRGYTAALETRRPYRDVVEVIDGFRQVTWSRLVLPLAREGIDVEMLMVMIQERPDES